MYAKKIKKFLDRPRPQAYKPASFAETQKMSFAALMKTENEKET